MNRLGTQHLGLLPPPAMAARSAAAAKSSFSVAPTGEGNIFDQIGSAFSSLFSKGSEAVNTILGKKLDALQNQGAIQAEKSRAAVAAEVARQRALTDRQAGKTTAVVAVVVGVAILGAVALAVRKRSRRK